MKQEVCLTPHEANVRALEFYHAGNDEQAGIFAKSVLQVEPDNVDSHNILGGVAIRKNNFYEAFYRFSRIIRLNPGNAQAISNLGMVMCHFEHLDDAIELFQRSLDLAPGEAYVMSNLGALLQRKGKEAEAIRLFDRVLEIEPDKDSTYFNRGICYLRLGRLREALADLDIAVNRHPDDGDAHYNRGLVKLTSGDIAAGFADYESRVHISNSPYYMGPFGEPKWTGEQDLNGKTILVHAEQGMGDSVQFMRYIPLLHKRGARVLMVMHEPLHTLADSLGVEVLQTGSKLPSFDYWSPLVSLALAFGTTLETIPPPAPFRCDTSKFSQVVKDRAGGKLRVGVCWSGNFQHKNDLNRSIDLRVFRSLFYMQDAAFFSLQKEVRPIDMQEFETCRNVIDLTADLKNVADTGALIGNLDVVVSCDSCVAHLAGSLGVQTYTLIPAYNVDWRWMQRRTDSPWYPSMRIYRQDQPGQSAWPDVMRRVATDLRNNERKAA